MLVTTPAPVSIPKIEPPNAYEWFASIIPFVREEPKRLLMDTWDRRGVPGSHCIHMDVLGSAYNLVFPACGTMACFAGWMLERTPLSTTSEWPMYAILTKLDQVISADYDLTELGNEIRRLFLGRGDYRFPREQAPGTPEYVEAALANLLRFLDKHEFQLKSILLTWD